MNFAYSLYSIHICFDGRQSFIKYFYERYKMGSEMQGDILLEIHYKVIGTAPKQYRLF